MIPSMLRIGAFDWDVIVSSDVAREDNCYGSTHYTKQRIFLDPEMTEQKREESLLHEAMHAVWWQVGLVEDPEVNKFQERIIKSLLPGLYQVLRDNPGLFPLVQRRTP